MKFLKLSNRYNIYESGLIFYTISMRVLVFKIDYGFDLVKLKMLSSKVNQVREENDCKVS